MMERVAINCFAAESRDSEPAKQYGEGARQQENPEVLRAKACITASKFCAKQGGTAGNPVPAA